LVEVVEEKACQRVVEEHNNPQIQQHNNNKRLGARADYGSSLEALHNKKFKNNNGG
jgi:hypothetical protein